MQISFLFWNFLPGELACLGGMDSGRHHDGIAPQESGRKGVDLSRLLENKANYFFNEAIFKRSKVGRLLSMRTCKFDSWGFSP
jgi:hypothetical protein